MILFAIVGALGALALQRYVIIGATAFGGAWTIIVGGLALTGTRVAVDAAARNNVWLAYPMNPAPGQLLGSARLARARRRRRHRAIEQSRQKEGNKWRRFRAM